MVVISVNCEGEGTVQVTATYNGRYGRFHYIPKMNQTYLFLLLISLIVIFSHISPHVIISIISRCFSFKATSKQSPVHVLNGPLSRNTNVIYNLVQSIYFYIHC